MSLVSETSGLSRRTLESLSILSQLHADVSSHSIHLPSTYAKLSIVSKQLSDMVASCSSASSVKLLKHFAFYPRTNEILVFLYFGVIYDVAVVAIVEDVARSRN